MAFLGPTDLRTFLNNTIISDYDPDRIEQAAYEMSLGTEVYTTDSSDGKVEVLSPTNKDVVINPGQFALLLTKETVTIPADKLAFISIKAKQKLKGLVNVSGFHVDPGFSGKLLFSVYNAGPSSITLRHDEPYFLIWFAELTNTVQTQDLYDSSSNHHQGQKGILPDYIDALKRGELASPGALVKKIDAVSAEFTEKLKELERKKLRNEYLLTLVIGLLVTLLIKFYWDSRAEESGYQKRVKEEQNFGKIYDRLDSIQSKSISLYQVDSLIKQRNKTANGKQQSK